MMLQIRGDGPGQADHVLIDDAYDVEAVGNDAAMLIPVSQIAEAITAAGGGS